jgi:hypothetical protein
VAEIHRTTVTPTKLEMLTAWLPRQPWYEGDGSPALARVGGFRLDDPDGEVGIEVMVVVDEAGPLVRYLVPLTYRGAPLPGADAALISTTEHGVLGTRWVYDAAHDPVAVDQLVALLRGRAQPQAQSESWTPDPTVEVRGALLAAAEHLTARGDADGLLLELREPAKTLTASLVRVLSPQADDAVCGAVGAVLAGWRLPDGTDERGAVLVVRDAAVSDGARTPSAAGGS